MKLNLLFLYIISTFTIPIVWKVVFLILNGHNAIFELCLEFIFFSIISYFFTKTKSSISIKFYRAFILLTSVFFGQVILSYILNIDLLSFNYKLSFIAFIFILVGMILNSIKEVNYKKEIDILDDEL